MTIPDHSDSVAPDSHGTAGNLSSLRVAITHVSPSTARKRDHSNDSNIESATVRLPRQPSPAEVNQEDSGFEVSVPSQLGDYELLGAIARGQLTDAIRSAPADLRRAVDGLSAQQMEKRYKNWTIRQIVHHVADSHVHSYIRFKWALTESNPLIKAYQEADWVALDDGKHGDIGPALALLDGLHQKWVQTLEAMSDVQFDRTFRHPESGNCLTLWSALHYYAWHARHHTAQILWLRAHSTPDERPLP